MRRTMVTTLLATALAVAGTAGAQEFAFKGLQLGATRDALTAHFAPLECVRPPNQFKGLGEELCSPKLCAGSSCSAGQNLLISYANQPIWRAQFGVVGNRFEQFHARMGMTSYEAVRDALRAVHGAGVESQDTRQTLGGAKFASRVWQIEGPTWQMTVIERAATVNEGAIDVRSSAFSRWVEAGGTAQKKTGDL